MKKRAKSKTSKRSSKNDQATEVELPQLVTVMMKVAERLESLEKKADRLESLERKMEVVIRQTSARPPEPRPVAQDFQRPAPAQHPQPLPQSHHGPQANHGQGGRMMYKAVCADCHKDCEVPFKPSGERPVYCKECFAKRKAGNTLQIHGGHGQVPRPPAKPISIAHTEDRVPPSSRSAAPSAHATAPKSKKHKPAKKKKK